MGTTIRSVLLAAAMALMFSGYSVATNLSDVWIVTPEHGKRAEFEKALRQHISFRKQQNDPRSWQVFVPAVGDNLDHYIIRACCFKWADMDSYRDWSSNAKTSQHWQKNVHQLVRHTSHHMAEIDRDNSHWPQDTSKYRYFEVVSMKPKSGHGAEIGSDMKKISDAAKAMEWEEHWQWSWGIGGATELSLVFPYLDWADMEPNDTTFAERLAKQMKSKSEAQELLKRWGMHFTQSETTIYRHANELSMQ